MTYVQAAAVNVKDAYATVWRHRILVATTFAVLMLASAALIGLIPRIYKASANVLIVNGNSRNDPTLSSPDIPTLATSTGVLDRVNQRLGLKMPLMQLKTHLTAKAPAYKSGIMKIEYADSSADRAALIANGVADELTSYYNQLSTSRYDDDLRALDKELTDQKGRIRSIDGQLKARAGIGSLAGGDKTAGSSAIDQLNALQTQRALANAEMIGDQAQAQAASSDAYTRSESARRDVLAADPLYHALQSQATEAQATLAAAQAQYTSRYPGLPQLRAKVDSLRNDMQREADHAMSSPHAFSPTVAGVVADQRKAQALVAGDQAKVAALDQEIGRRSHDLGGMAPIALLALERDAAMDEYRSLSAHRGQTLMDRADALSLGSVVVIDRAIPSEALAGVGPRKLIATFALLSLVLALGSAFIAEQLDPRLRRAAHIESLYGKPVVATLGQMR